MITNFYVKLNVATNASDAEIKSAYKKLALTYHPDKILRMPNESDTDFCARKMEAKQHFQALSKAYETLIDHHKRKQYDNAMKLHNSNYTNANSNTRSKQSTSVNLINALIDAVKNAKTNDVMEYCDALKADKIPVSEEIFILSVTPAPDIFIGGPDIPLAILETITANRGIITEKSLEAISSIMWHAEMILPVLEALKASGSGLSLEKLKSLLNNLKLFLGNPPLGVIHHR